MELLDFLKQTQADVRAAVAEAMNDPGGGYPYPESVFAEVVMQHMAEIGMTFEPAVCHYEAKLGNSGKVRLTGYAISEDSDQLDLFVSLYMGVETITPIPDSDTKTAAEQCLRFLAMCAEGKLPGAMDEATDAYPV